VEELGRRHNLSEQASIALLPMSTAIVVGRKRCLEEGTFTAVNKRSRCSFTSNQDDSSVPFGSGNDHVIQEFAVPGLGDNILQYVGSSLPSYTASDCGQCEPFDGSSRCPSNAESGLDDDIESVKKGRSRRMSRLADTRDVSDACSDLDIDNWARRLSESLQECTVWEDVHSRLKPQLQNFRKEMLYRVSKTDGSYDDGTRIDPSSEAGYRALYESCQQKVNQMTVTQQILSRKILAQHEKIQSLLSNENVKDEQLASISSQLSEAREQIRKLRESNQALQYYLSNQQFPDESHHNILHRRGPDVF